MSKKQIILNQIITDTEQFIRDFNIGLTDSPGAIRSLSSILGKIKEVKKIEEKELKDLESEDREAEDFAEKADKDKRRNYEESIL